MILDVCEMINQLQKEKSHILIAIDGRCAAGKTSLAARLQDIYNCNVIHMDHFFLRGEQRTEARMNIPGENVDHERFLEEVLIPLREKKDFAYRPYNCKLQSFTEEIQMDVMPINIIEGSYCCHPSLWEYYDKRVFLKVNPEEQLRRIVERDGMEKSKLFQSKWIPLEEKYFAEYDIEKRCDLCFETF